MKIIKVIVDEIPESCWDCMRFDFDFKGIFKKECPYCLITGGDITIDYKSTRPDWCPLETQGGFIIDDEEVKQMILNKEGSGRVGIFSYEEWEEIRKNKEC